MPWGTPVLQVFNDYGLAGHVGMVFAGMPEYNFGGFPPINGCTGLIHTRGPSYFSLRRRQFVPLNRIEVTQDGCNGVALLFSQRFVERDYRPVHLTL